MITNSIAAVENDIRDIKPPLPIASGWAWLWWTLGALALAVHSLALVAESEG